MKPIFPFVVFAFASPLGLFSLLLARALVVLFLELAFRLQPLVQVVVHVVNVTATFDVNLMRSLTDFCEGWPVPACFYGHARPNACWHVLGFRGQIGRLHSFVLPYKGLPLP